MIQRLLCPAVPLLLLALAAPAALAQEERQVFQTSFLLEARLFDAASDRYAEAREREVEAWNELRAATRNLDEALGDPTVTVARLRELEREVGTLRETAFARSRETASLRQELYWSLERVAEIGLTLERLRDRSLVRTETLDGLWRIDIRDTRDWGLLELEVEGTRVTGTYRMTNGGQGSVSGSVVDDRVELVRTDAATGTDMTLEGTVDRDTGTMDGQWVRRELAAGEPSAGYWSARKLSASDVDTPLPDAEEPGLSEEDSEEEDQGTVEEEP